MSDDIRDKMPAQINRDEHIKRGNLAAKRAALYLYDSNTDDLLPVSSDNPIPTSGGGGGGGDASAANQVTGNASLSSIDTKTPALGQALAAASTPVVLTAAQLSTLTPPAAITGFATSAKQDTLLAELQLKADLTETQPVSLASVPSHAVTNAGTFAVQNTAALPAGTNNIGDVDVLSLPALPAGTNNIGDVDVLSSVSSTLDHGSNLDIDTTAEQITTTSFAAKFGVTVKAAVDNTDTVYIGNSDVTAGTTAATDGFPLEPGESITLPVNNSNLLYAIGAAANQKVFWSAV